MVDNNNPYSEHIVFDRGIIVLYPFCDLTRCDFITQKVQSAGFPHPAPRMEVYKYESVRHFSFVSENTFI